MLDVHQWVIVKISGDYHHYKVFASWSGGYVSGDSWRLNSGITKVEEDGDWYLFHGKSGSIYRCHKDSYGITSPFNNSVLAGYKHRLGDKFEILQEKPDVMNIDWLI